MEAPGTDSSRSSVKPRTGAVRRTRWIGGLAAMTVLALLLVAGQQGLTWNEERQKVDNAGAAMSAAQAQIKALIEVSAGSSETSLKKLRRNATGAFREELEAQSGGLRDALAANDVVATGDAVSAGVVKLDGSRATVIVAATGSVENKSTPKAQPRNYRLRVDLERHGDRWLISGLEFVP